MTGPAARSPVVEYFANTPIASPFPTLPYRFQTLTPENVNLRQGLGTLPTSTPLLQSPTAPALTQLPTPAAASNIVPAAPFVPALPTTTQYLGPAPTVAQIEAAIAAQAAQANAPVGVPVAAPAAAPVTGRMGGMVSFAEGGMPRLTAQEAGSQFDVREYIDPQTGRFYINEFKRDQVFNPQLRQAEDQARMARFAEGGVASLSLPEMAEQVRAAGRGDDTMLAHITPEEAGILKLLGGSGTINPKTGQPEFLKKFVKKIVPKEIYKPISNVGKAIESGIEKIAQNKILGPIAQIASMAHPATAALYAGLAPEGSSFDIKRAAKAAAIQQIGEAAMDYARGPGAGGGVEYNVPDGGSFDFGPASNAPNASSLAPPPVVDVAALPTSQVGALQTPGFADVGEIPGVTSFSGATPPPPQTYLQQASNYISDIPSRVGEGLRNLPQTLAELPGKTLDYAIDNPLATTIDGTQLYAGKEAKEEMDKYNEEQRRLEEEEEERRRRYDALFSRTLGRVPMGAGGGIVGLAKGGMPTFEYGGTTAPTGEPRMVTGAGDGMSDNVPATIEGVQEARLANDEFVVPADVVADIGNGSSNAGAKKLYAMMDRVRKARHGTVKQPPEIRAERFMPA